MTTRLVIGVDAGGTRTRAALCAPDGRLRGEGDAGPGNPVAVHPTDAAASVAGALRAALGTHPPSAVVGGMVGIAGHGRLADPAVRGAYADAWRSVGLECPLWTCGDATIAFAAGTPAEVGTVLIAGTGAVAVRIESGRETRVVDGLGWLLGDEGSGFWIGLAAVRRAARTLQAGAPPTPLTRAVLAALVGSGDVHADTLVTRAYEVPRTAIAALAPTVLESARDGQPDGVRLTRLAAARLVRTLTAADPGAAPIVLAGGVLTNDSPLTRLLNPVVETRWGSPPLVAGPAERAAAWLAARRVRLLSGPGPDGSGQDAAAVRMHARFLRGQLQPSPQGDT